MKRVGFMLLGVALATLTSGLSSAATTTQLGFSGQAEVGSTFLDFGNYNSAPPYASPGGYATFLVTEVDPGIFLQNGVATNQTGMIQSLSTTTFPPSTPFITLTTASTTLDLFATGVAAETGGGGCITTPQGFLLCNTSAGASATIGITGYVTGDKVNGGSKEAFDAVLTASFAGQTVAGLLSNLPYTSPFEGTISVTLSPSSVVPEPATLLLMGFGLTGLGIVARRKFARS